MQKIREVIVVEGKYDKNTLLQIVDAVVICTDGFGIFKDPQKQELLRLLARRRGLILFTDSDGAGTVIRSFLNGIVEKEYIKNAYIPDIPGKERRKSLPSREGKLGVEGMTPEIILSALRSAGATFSGSAAPESRSPITKADLYALGLSGSANSAQRRRQLQKALDLPEKLSANSLLQVLNVITDRAELEKLLRQNPAAAPDR